MADPDPSPADTGPGMPLWVRGFVVAAVVVAVLLVVFVLTGDHGPGGHGP